MACADGTPPPPPPLETHFVVDTPDEMIELLDKENGTAGKLKKYDRLIIELCCGETSKLGSQPRYSDGCYVLRVTIRLDFTSKRGLR